jgi:hypothetical protein
LAPSKPIPFLDAFLFNQEVAMLRYRLALHSAFATATLIVESNSTFSGQPKPSLARSSLAAHELARYNVELFTFAPATLLAQRPKRGPRGRLRCKLLSGEPGAIPICPTWLVENAQRASAARLIASSPRYSGHAVFFSDVDELLDPRAVPRALHLLGLRSRGSAESRTGHAAPRRMCINPGLRSFYYGEHCPINERQDYRSSTVLFSADGPWLQTTGELRFPAQNRTASALCPAPEGGFGWHFSYAFSTQDILAKLRSFSHHQDSFVRAVVEHADAAHMIDARARGCLDLFNRSAKSMYDARPYDGVLPPLAGWPRHALAP